MPVLQVELRASPGRGAVARGRARVAGMGAALALASLACGTAPRGLVVFNAAALGPPFKQLGATLVAAGARPMRQENSPSLEAVRKLTDLGKVPDLLAVADVGLLDSLVVPGHATWYLVFGSNALVLAYGPGMAARVAQAAVPWYDLLLAPGVRVGRSDPKVDPSGYRTLLALDLAERHHRVPGLAARLREAMPDKYVRHAEADLSALVQTGELDFIWTYRNLARAHGLQWVELPPDVNLESMERAAWYATASVEVPGRPGGPPLRVVGAPILFALTIPREAASPDEAVRFIAALLGVEGRDVMSRSGFAMLDRPYLVGSGVPEAVRIAVGERS